MSPRTYQTFDWSRNDRAHWLVKSDEWRNPLKIIDLPAGSDLLVAFLEEAIAVHREGWTIDNLTTKFGWFIGHRDVPRRILRVAIFDNDPRAPNPASMHAIMKKTW
jgi:hypothetical protein